MDYSETLFDILGGSAVRKDVKNSNHKELILKQIEQYSFNVDMTIQEVKEYLGKIGISQCGAIHEENFQDPVSECPLRELNVACAHSFDFLYYSYDEALLSGGYNFFGLQFFVIAYFLFQKGYGVKWYIDDKDFIKLYNQNRKYDKLDRDKFNEIKLYQLRMGEQLIDEYVIPVKEAFNKYLENN